MQIYLFFNKKNKHGFLAIIRIIRMNKNFSFEKV